jgi:hypothetical protein
MRLAVEVSATNKAQADASGSEHTSTPQLFYTHFYNHARRLRFKKLLCIELCRCPSGHLKPLLDPGGRFVVVSEAKRLQIYCVL